jgi:SAM-dependent methyltransferase
MSDNPIFNVNQSEVVLSKAAMVEREATRREWEGRKFSMSRDWPERQQTEHLAVLRDISRYVREDSVVIELGAGLGFLSYHLAHTYKHALVFETDLFLFPQIVWGEKPNNLFRAECTMQVLPFKDHVADIIFVKSALHHADDLRQVFTEAKRVLKNDGIMLAFNETKRSVFEASDHTDAHQKGYNDHSYSLGDYERAAKMAGLRTKVMFPSQVDMPPNEQFSGGKLKIVTLKIIKKIHILWLIHFLYPVLCRLFILPNEIMFVPIENKER